MRKLRSQGNGALKATAINMDLSDQDIEKKLDNTLHKPLEVLRPDHVPDVHESPCFHFACRGNPSLARAEQLVKSLSWALQEHDVDAGSMLLFSLSDKPHVSVPVILGVSMKKPMSHTFVLATLNHEEVKFSEDGGSIQFKSSHQLFWNLLEEHSGSPTETVEIDVDVWTCSAFLDSGDNNALKTNPDSLQCTFKISSKRALKNKPVVVKLPFSLDKRYRKTRKVQEHGPQRKKKKSLKNMGKFKKPQAKKNDPGPIVISSSSSDSESNSSSSETIKDAVDMAEVEEEQALPLSNVVKQEHASVREVAREIETADDQQEQKAQTLQQSFAAAPSRPSQQSTFFSKECGLDEGSLAATGRAICYKCKKTIPINSVRFSWYFSTTRPLAWVHSYCVYPLVKDTGLVKRATERLKAIVEDGNTHPHLFQPVASEAKKNLDLLKSNPM